MIKAVRLTFVLAAAASPALAQSKLVTLPTEPGLRAIYCSAVLSATAQSMRPAGGGSNSMADELADIAGKWKTSARSLGSGMGRAAADTDQLIAEQTGRLYSGAGQGLPPGTFAAAQTCQSEGGALPGA